YSDILIRKDKISEIGKINLYDEKQIDIQGNIVIPGLIDIHIHGAIGIDVMEASSKQLNEISCFLASQGTTSFLPTTITSSYSNLFNAIENIKNAKDSNILGVHIEGPFINKNKKGCHDENYIRNPDLEIVERTIINGLHTHYTIAPELENAEEFIKNVVSLGRSVSLGHSEATSEEAKLSLNAGANIFTHLFNAMRPIHHREPGIIGAALTSDAFVEVICDGIHVHPEIIKLIYKTKGSKKIVLVTDAMQACGLGDGNYSFGGFEINVVNGVARKKDGTLASSTLTMFNALKNIMKYVNIPLEVAIDMATINPAKAIGVDRLYGSIEKNKIADLIILDENLNIKYVINKGKMLP
ncbi:MAG TPA: N-acetylglucosamine-6-phosphate deacetylase, partial [Acholeplasmataceae bacterium]|nr:N-acetylglucosamine-6-phosphate deacetylase [Acholeplasmataceae bacterium]